MNQAKHNILNRLRSAGATEKVADSPRYTPWGEDEAVTEPQKVARFVAALQASHAQVIKTEASGLANCLSGLVDDKGVKTAAIGTDGEFIEAFRSGLANTELTAFSEQIEQWKTRLFDDTQLGVTHVRAGIADTGALVVWPGPSEPRTLSLVPPCHIAVIKQSALYCNFPQVMAQQGWQVAMPTNALLITGPSKTADIQQTLAYGAHGPSELVVILLTDK